MSRQNTRAAYGSVAKGFHWLTALLIVTAFPLGVVAERLPYDTAAELAFKAQLFSVHKTLGVTIFFVALARILWAITQEKPALLNPEKRGEAFLAELVHWLLYISLVLVPLSGWLHHAATQGFAPILWPFGQGLPFVAKSETVAQVFGAWHFVMTKLLLAALVLHIAGALKHALFERDGTLRRMWFGKDIGVEPPLAAHSKKPVLAGFALYGVAIAAATWLGLSGGAGAEATQANAPALKQGQSEWAVQEGRLAITTKQFGEAVSGQFENWTAAINYDEAAVEGRNGDVRVEIAIASLTLGSVTSDALGAEFFDAENFAVAVFEADIVAADVGYLARGTLTLKGQSVPVDVPFSLVIEGGEAQMQGQVSVDRRSFGIGKTYSSEGEVGFEVVINVALTATR